MSALILCAGQGKRIGGCISKQFIEISGHPLIAYTVKKFQEHPLIDNIVLVTREEYIKYCQKDIVEKYGFTKVINIVSGGEERQDSVYSGLQNLDDTTSWVVVHDGVRPLISLQTIDNVLKVAFEKKAAVVGVPAKDTIKIINPDFTVQGTPPRQSLWHVQTPQVFEKKLILKAYTEAKLSGLRGTDDASLVENMGVEVHMVRGEYENIKVTTPEDLMFIQGKVKLDGLDSIKRRNVN
ncbi:MAG: 2-C-methyl-D-erythritol 4-phosphate cytidylyltransferase [Clostridia bacterium]|nr:2-C-methyl-D-erythritol 4-phosphate cytidylyltransferase [Clostridia bacterium]